MQKQARWIFADASTVGVVRFAAALPGAARLESVRSLSSEAYPTFSDALLTYSREAGVPLRGAEAVLAVAAPPAGDAIPVARSRWTISRSGLAGMFGQPVTIINDVAATAWSLLGDGAFNLESFGGGKPDFGKPGRWVIALLDDGVNAAGLDIAEDGSCHVIDGEAGHAGFSPADAAECALMESLRQHRGQVSWEQALTSGWADQQASAAERQAWAGMAGAFCGDLILQFGAWSGVILCGKHAIALRDPARQIRFIGRLEDKKRYGRFLAQGCRAILPSRDPLMGALALSRARMRGKGHIEAA